MNRDLSWSSNFGLKERKLRRYLKSLTALGGKCWFSKKRNAENTIRYHRSRWSVILYLISPPRMPRMQRSGVNIARMMLRLTRDQSGVMVFAAHFSPAEIPSDCARAVARHHRPDKIYRKSWVVHTLYTVHYTRCTLYTYITLLVHFRNHLYSKEDQKPITSTLPILFVFGRVRLD